MERPKQNTYQQRPPERAVKFLNWYCNAAYRDEIEGDLHEQFAQHVLEKGVRQARLRYWINIILFIRSYTVNGKTMNFKPFGDIMLWPSYARVAVRHLNNNKTTGLLNIGGLAIGLACCILALLFVQNETGYDQFHVNKDTVYQIYTDEVEKLYRPLDCPVRVLWGQQDNWIPAEKGDALAALISDSACAHIQGAGHLVQEDRPEAIVAAVLDQIQASSAD